ncbi:rhodanese-like domain-containing protein [Parapedobacter soli]|uniref:rhodanese-like domain-containing protein n=1 Tax=Parapedobacter soli TaxID=416955 RepID=UPI0021CA7C1E|nr:rhodanese-like domain-containing protein [Parapedobacter soli]
MWPIVTLLYLAFAPTVQDSTGNPEFTERLNNVYRHSIPVVTVDELPAMMKRGAVVLDTRERGEFDISHIRRARHVGYIWFDMREVYDIQKTDTVVVYCAIGNRSERIGEKLRKAGYRNVFNLFGGIYEWVNQRNPVYNTNNVQTTEIHVYDKHWAQWLERGTRVDD